MIQLHSTRDRFSDDATLSVLLYDGKPFGFLCEDQDRGLNKSDALAHIAAVKVRGETAIPAGVYEVGVRASPKHGPETLYLRDVPGFQYIDVHPGNDDDDTEGCLLPGLTRDVERMTVGKSRLASDWLHQQLVPIIRAGGRVTWTIDRATDAVLPVRAA